MARSRWEDLLPRSNSGTASRSELLGQAVASTRSGGGIGTGGSIAGEATGNSGPDITPQLTSLATQIGSLTSVQQSQIGVLQSNTEAIAQNTATRGSSGSSIGSTVANVASGVLGGGLSTLSPLIGGLISLFGGGGEQRVVAPTPFTLPAPVQSEAGITTSAPGQVVPVSYGQSGQPRAQAANVSPQVTIQVNAMDSQSFLDHSDQIAMAVKRAILSSSSLNDVISEL